MQVLPRTPQEPEEYLYNALNIPRVNDGKTIAPARLKGFTGIVPGSNGLQDTRPPLASIYEVNVGTTETLIANTLTTYAATKTFGVGNTVLISD